MNDETPDDASLLQQYAGGSEPAFCELVQRHVGMVHATARRVVAVAPHLADDVTQTVFTDLAKKAARLPAGTVLAGWLHRHTCYLAMNAARAENRRRTREKIAMEINAVNENSAADAQWLQLAPVLDDALSHLDAEDRDAIVLRYLEQYDLRSVGLALGTNENTAQKRVSRALEKLRGVLARRGVTLASVNALGSTLEACVVTTAPAELAATISATAVNTTVTLGASKPMISSKLATGAAAIAAGLLVTVIIAQNDSAVSPAAAPAPTVAATTNVQTAAADSRSAKIVATTSVPARGDSPALPDNPADNLNPFGPVDETTPANPSMPQTAQMAAPAATAAPAAASEAPGGSNGYGDGSKRMPTVTNGQLTMTTTYPNGTVTTIPYKEAGATVTISPGDKPNTYVLTYRNEITGKIAAILKGVVDSPPDTAAGGNTTGE